MPEWEVLVSLRGSQNHATDTLIPTIASSPFCNG